MVRHMPPLAKALPADPDLQVLREQFMAMAQTVPGFQTLQTPYRRRINVAASLSSDIIQQGLLMIDASEWLPEAIGCTGKDLRDVMKSAQGCDEIAVDLEAIARAMRHTAVHRAEAGERILLAYKLARARNQLSRIESELPEAERLAILLRERQTRGTRKLRGLRKRQAAVEEPAE
ncbi:MAG TPA: hypothetical protein VEK57_02535 [Thermoanaerobaculia bacterium]|nr:hypothetical protein [Thermoanaerobaculia bacterium]